MTVNVVSDKVMKFVEQNVSKESINMDNKQQHNYEKRRRRRTKNWFDFPLHIFRPNMKPIYR